jgi:gliding motility associated protien GldN
MKSLSLSFLLFLPSMVLISQGNVGPSNVIIPNAGGQPQPGSGVIDGVYEKKDVLSKKRAIPYEFVRENDYIWGKRTWSYIDLREKINHPLYYPHEKTLLNGQIETVQGRYSLYYILRSALFNGQLMGYYDRRGGDINNPILESGGDAFTMPAKRDYSKSVSSDSDYKKDVSKLTADISEGTPQPKKVLDANNQAQDVFHLKGTKNKIDVPKEYMAVDADLATQLDPTSETLDRSLAELDAGGNPAAVDYRIITEIPYRADQVVKYYLKEDWFFDKERSVMDVRIIGLAPVVIDSNTMVEKVLFWVYFPQARDVLKNYYAYDPKSTVGGNTFDHLFMTRRFNAVVYKETSLYDRKIEDYRFGAEALYESEKVKNEIRMLEHNVWNF